MPFINPETCNKNFQISCALPTIDDPPMLKTKDAMKPGSF